VELNSINIDTSHHQYSVLIWKFFLSAYHQSTESSTFCLYSGSICNMYTCAVAWKNQT